MTFSVSAAASFLYACNLSFNFLLSSKLAFLFTAFCQTKQTKMRTVSFLYKKLFSKRFPHVYSISWIHIFNKKKLMKIRGLLPDGNIYRALS
ncbi:hypothetical protein Hanom_Chr03g00211131 [Helianthus anomalus]